MMGRDSKDQGEFFYAFELEDLVPDGHLLRGIDRFLDLSGLHDYLAPYYSHTGRPSIDPELLMRMLIVGYCFGIRSERQLCIDLGQLRYGALFVQATTWLMFARITERSLSKRPHPKSTVSTEYYGEYQDQQ